MKLIFKHDLFLSMQDEKSDPKVFIFVNYTCNTLMSNPSLSVRCGRRTIKEGNNIINRDLLTLLLIEAPRPIKRTKTA